MVRAYRSFGQFLGRVVTSDSAEEAGVLVPTNTLSLGWTMRGVFEAHVADSMGKAKGC